MVSVFGDIELDLRETYVRDEEIRIQAWSLFGDVRVIVPEGVEVEVSGFGVFGDRKVELAPVPRRPGTPLIKLASYSMFGDMTVRNNPPTDRLREWVRRALGRDTRGLH